MRWRKAIPVAFVVNKRRSAAGCLAPMLEPLKASCTAFGRDYDSFDITSMWDNQAGLDAVVAFADLGLSRLLVAVFALAGDPIAGLTKPGSEIIATL